MPEEYDAYLLWKLSAQQQIDNFREETKALRAENAKLRKLVLHMYTCMGNVDADGNYECFSCEYEGAECDYDRRLRELGIEVDE